MKGQGVFMKLLILELSFDKQVKVEEGFSLVVQHMQRYERREEEDLYEELGVEYV